MSHSGIGAETLTFDAHDVRQLSLVSGIFPPERGRRGIYVLYFADGSGYVGQTIDICARFANHRRTYPDLTMLQFARVPQSLSSIEMDQLEVQQMRIQAQSMALRNIIHYVGGDILLRPSKLDPVVPVEHQLSFLESGAVGPDATNRVIDPTQLAKGQRAYERLMKHPMAESACTSGQLYAQQSVPCPRATERRFWAVSAAPSTNGGARLLVVSINTPETLVIGAFDDEMWGFVNVSRTSLVEDHGSLEAFAEPRRDWLDIEEAGLRGRAGATRSLSAAGTARACSGC